MNNTAFPKDSSFVKGHGVHVDAAAEQRMSERHKRIIEANLDSIRGKTVLDLASHNGRWTYAALQAGAALVFGIEGRQVLIDRGLPDFAKIDPARYRFACGDVYDMHALAAAWGIRQFDTILCLGIYYHITDHYRLMREMRRFNPTTIIIDSGFLKTDEPVIRFRTEDSSDMSMATPEHATQSSSLSGRVSIGLLRLMAKLSGYDVTFIPWRRGDSVYPESVKDYFDQSNPSQRFTVRLTAQPTKPVW